MWCIAALPLNFPSARVRARADRRSLPHSLQSACNSLLGLPDARVAEDLSAPTFAPRSLARDCRPRPPRSGDNADALPPSSRDTGNRISFAGLRGFAETRDSDSGRARAESRVQSVALDAVSVTPDPCPSSRPQPAIPRDARRQGAGASGATPISVRRSSSGIRREEARRPLGWPNAEGKRAPTVGSLAATRCEPHGRQSGANSELVAVWSDGMDSSRQ